MSGRYPYEFGGRPRLLLAYADPVYASECGRYLRRLGWEVEMVASAAEAGALVREYRPQVIAIDAELLDDNGWLNGAQKNGVRVILVADGDSEHSSRIGADRQVCRHDGAEGLAMAVLGRQAFSEAI